jgi:hypothetical protein
MGRLRNANQYVSNQTAAVAGANTSITLVGNLGCTDHAAVPVDANGNLVTTQKKMETNWKT